MKSIYDVMRFCYLNIATNHFRKYRSSSGKLKDDNSHSSSAGTGTGTGSNNNNNSHNEQISSSSSIAVGGSTSSSVSSDWSNSDDCFEAYTLALDLKCYALNEPNYEFYALYQPKIPTYALRGVTKKIYKILTNLTE
jgi:hypothetical protein